MTLANTMLDYYKKEYAVFNPEKALKFLDLLLPELRKIESKSDFMVHDHIKNEYFSVDITKVQNIYDHCFRWYYYRRLEEKNIWLMNLKLVVEQNTTKELYGFMYISIITTLQFFSSSFIPKRIFSLDDFVAKLFDQMVEEVSYINCKDLVNILINEKLFIVSYKNGFYKQIEISDDTVRLDLACMSTYPVCVVPEDNPIKFSCFYAIYTLSSVMSKFQLTDNGNSVNKMLNIYKDKNDQDSFDKLLKFYQNLSSLDFYEIQKDADKNSQDYENLVMVYVNKFTLQEYFFQVLVLSPFLDYYASNIRANLNLLYSRRKDLVYRLYP